MRDERAEGSDEAEVERRVPVHRAAHLAELGRPGCGRRGRARQWSWSCRPHRPTTEAAASSCDVVAEQVLDEAALEVLVLVPDPVALAQGGTLTLAIVTPVAHRVPAPVQVHVDLLVGSLRGHHRRSAVCAPRLSTLASRPARRVPVSAVADAADTLLRPGHDVGRAGHDVLLAAGAEVGALRGLAGEAPHGSSAGRHTSRWSSCRGPGAPSRGARRRDVGGWRGAWVNDRRVRCHP